MSSGNNTTLWAIDRQEDSPCTVLHHALAYANTTHIQSVCSITSTSTAFHLAIKIVRVGQDRDRNLMFRGWSRLCLHAASLSAAEGAAAAATAVARAARAEAMETEAIAAAEKAEAWKRAAAASADAAAIKEQAQREVADLARQKESMGQVDRQQRERGAKLLVRCCGAWNSLLRIVSCLAESSLPCGQKIERKNRCAPCCIAPPPSAHGHT